MARSELIRVIGFVVAMLAFGVAVAEAQDVRRYCRMERRATASEQWVDAGMLLLTQTGDHSWTVQPIAYTFSDQIAAPPKSITNVTYVPNKSLQFVARWPAEYDAKGKITRKEQSETVQVTADSDTQFIGVAIGLSVKPVHIRMIFQVDPPALRDDDLEDAVCVVNDPRQ